MAEFRFDATAHQPWQGDGSEAPATFALRLWLHFQNAEDDMDFATACELSAYDGDVWEELQKWAWSQDIDAMSEAAAAALGRALGRRKPRKGKGVIARRNAHLQAVAAALAREYGVRPTRAPSTAVASAASIMADLPGTPSEQSINEVLTRNLGKPPA